MYFHVFFDKLSNKLFQHFCLFVFFPDEITFSSILDNFLRAPFYPSRKKYQLASNYELTCTLSVYGEHGLMAFSIYTLSDLGELSNLIGSLSRTIQQYSPPSEWIMCELGFFPIFIEKDLLKVDNSS